MEHYYYIYNVLNRVHEYGFDDNNNINQCARNVKDVKGVRRSGRRDIFDISHFAEESTNRSTAAAASGSGTHSER